MLMERYNKNKNYQTLYNLVLDKNITEEEIINSYEKIKYNLSSPDLHNIMIYTIRKRRNKFIGVLNQHTFFTNQIGIVVTFFEESLIYHNSEVIKYYLDLYKENKEPMGLHTFVNCLRYTGVRNIKFILENNIFKIDSHFYSDLEEERKEEFFKYILNFHEDDIRFRILYKYIIATKTVIKDNEIEKYLQYFKVNEEQNSLQHDLFYKRYVSGGFRGK